MKHVLKNPAQGLFNLNQSKLFLLGVGSKNHFTRERHAVCTKALLGCLVLLLPNLFFLWNLLKKKFQKITLLMVVFIGHSLDLSTFWQSLSILLNGVFFVIVACAYYVLLLEAFVYQKQVQAGISAFFIAVFFLGANLHADAKRKANLDAQLASTVKGYVTKYTYYALDAGLTLHEIKSSARLLFHLHGEDSKLERLATYHG